jgi:hypothetical protein
MFNAPFIWGSAGKDFKSRIGFNIEETVPCATSFRSSPPQRPCSSSRVSRSPEVVGTAEDMVEVTAGGTTPRLMVEHTTPPRMAESTMPEQPATRATT